MKRYLYILLGMLCFSLNTTAATYTVPTDDPKLAKLASFPMEDFQVGLDAGKISYKLPEILTGKDVRIEMTKVFESGNVREYSGPLIDRGECTGPLDKPNCFVEFKNLNLDTADARNRRAELVSNSFRDPALRSSMLELVNRFAEDEPIGTIQGDDTIAMPRLSGRWWRSFYQNPTGNGETENSICFVSRANRRYEGYYRVGNRACHNATTQCGQCPAACSFCGNLKNVVILGQHMAGIWEVPAARSAGWFDFTFDPWGNFEGTYGPRTDAYGYDSPGKWRGSPKR